MCIWLISVMWLASFKQASAEAVMQRFQHKLEQAATLRMHLEQISILQGKAATWRFTICACKPVYYNVSGSLEYHYDGHYSYLVNPMLNEVMRTATFQVPPTLNTFAAFFKKKPLHAYTHLETIEFDGRQTVKAIMHDRTGNEFRLYVDTETALPVMAQASERNSPSRFFERYSDIRLNDPVAISRFQYMPPADALVLRTGFRKPFIKVGTILPDITLTALTGEAVRLKDAAAKHRTTLLTFWTPWGGLCRSELLELNKMLPQLQTQDIGVFTVSENEGRDVVATAVKANQLSVPVALNGINANDAAAQLGVRQLPTIVVIDSAGKVLAFCEWISRETLPKVLHSAGYQEEH